MQITNNRAYLCWLAQFPKKKKKIIKAQPPQPLAHAPHHLKR